MLIDLRNQSDLIALINLINVIDLVDLIDLFQEPSYPEDYGQKKVLYPSIRACVTATASRSFIMWRRTTRSHMISNLQQPLLGHKHRPVVTPHGVRTQGPGPLQILSLPSRILSLPLRIFLLSERVLSPPLLLRCGCRRRRWSALIDAKGV